MFHWLFLISAICTTSANITPIQSLSQQNKQTTGVFHGHQTWSSRQLLQIDFQDFFESIEEAAADALPDAVFTFYDEQTGGSAGTVIVLAVALEALLEADLDVGGVDTEETIERINDIFIAGFDNPECTELITEFSDFLPPGRRRRRRLSMFDIQAEIAIAANEHIETFGDFFEFVFDVTFWELTEEELQALEFSDLGITPLILLPFGAGLVEVIESECDPEQSSVLDAVSETVEIFRDYLEILEGDGDDDDDDSDESDESGESGDDAKVVNEAHDNLDLEERSEGNEDESEVVTLGISTSTMTNLWIGFIVFCGLNISLCWCLMGRKRKKSVYHETAEEVPSVSVNH